MAYLENHLLYYKKSCPFCQKVLRFMEANHLTMDTRETTQPGNQNDLIRIGGKKQVPCLVINGKLEKHRGVIFDVENYRERQNEKLENLATRMAEKCRRTHRRVTLSPMNAAERRIIHITVEKIKGVTSYSEGNEPHRRVVIVED